jgi:hypothetical protein
LLPPPLPVVVLTSDNYHPILRCFCHQFNKHWSPSQLVTVVGFKEPEYKLPTNFDFWSAGNQSDYPIGKWSDALIKYLHDKAAEVFALFFDDYLLTRDANVHAVNILYRYMLQFRYVIKTDLCEERLHAWGTDLDYGTVAYLDLIKSNPDSQYHMSLWPGLWSRDRLLEVLIPNESPWQVELEGTPRLRTMDALVLGTKQSPVRIFNAKRGGVNESDHTGMGKLSETDVNELKGLGYM